MERKVIDIDSLEMAEILLFLAKEFGLSNNEMDEQKAGICGVMRISDYITGSPGFVGDLYIISWDGAPEFITVVGRSGNIKFDGYNKLHLIGNLGHCDCHWNNDKTKMSADEIVKREG